MMDALEKSTEAPSLISIAKRYLRGIISSTAQTERRMAMAASKDSHPVVTPPSVGVVHNAQFIDLTEANES